jgi:hypothetical protein
MFAAASLVWACASDGPTAIDSSPKDGLRSSQAQDSAATTPAPTPAPASNPTPGYVHGTVRAPGANAGPGQDTLSASIRIAGAIVTAYPRVRSTLDTAGAGPMAAQVIADANGQFQLPTLPGGEYIVTFNPPVALSATYGGVWVTATIHENSHVFPWWVTLWKKN